MAFFECVANNGTGRPYTSSAYYGSKTLKLKAGDVVMLFAGYATAGGFTASNTTSLGLNQYASCRRANIDGTYNFHGGYDSGASYTIIYPVQ
jgi:hypothetical protein